MTDGVTNAQQWPDEGALERWMADHVEGFRGPVSLSKFEGGQSNPTFRIDAGSGRYVLRRKPMGNVLPGAHAVDREFRVLSAMRNAGIPVAPVHSLCTDEGVIGSMFYVMDFIDGRVFWDPRLPELAPDERSAIFASMNDNIARIHSLSPAEIGLADFGRSEDYLKRQINRWTRQFEASRLEPNPAMDNLIQWLPNHVPTEHPARLVHGDYRLDNVLIHPTEPRIVAVLDWELSTIGNPLADFAYHMLSWYFAPDLFRGLAGENLSELGIPSQNEYLERYLQRTGLEPPGDWQFYVILSMFRIASILQGIARRSVEGSAADARAAEIGAKAAPIARLAWEMVEQRRE